jgi:hypothetical protein
MGGLHLVSIKPWLGWGKGESGNAYMQWIQDPSASTFHGGMTNSYLHIAVEFGLPVLAIAICALLIPFFLGSTCAGTRPFQTIAQFRAVAASVVAFAVCSCFTTSWQEITVSWLIVLSWVVLAVLGLHLLGRNVFSAWAARSLKLSIASAAIIATTTYLLSLLVSHRSAYIVSRDNSGVITYRARTARLSKPQLVIAPDHQVLGALYGKTIRGVLLKHKSVEVFSIVPPAAAITRAEGAILVVCGSRISSVVECGPSFTAVAPVGPPNAMVQADALILPSHDLFGYHDEWKRLLEIARKPVLTIPWATQNLSMHADGIIRYAMQMKEE